MSQADTPPDSSGSNSSGSQDVPMPELCRRALKAFKKRLKLARLDDESRLGVGPLTGGSKGGIVAIRPPDRYPPAVWDELVNQGKLRRAGHGLYELVQQ